MAKEKKTGLGVTNFYGVRETGGTVGKQPSAGPYVELTFDLDVTGMATDLYAPVVIPAGSKIVEVYVETVEAFTITTAAAKCYIGTEGAESTNGIQIDDTVLEAVGVVKLATGKLLGKWNDASSYIDTSVTVGYANSTLDPSGTAGKARVIVRYLKSKV